MKADSILVDLWRIKDELARESGYDIERFFEDLRKWSDEHPHKGPVVRNAEELKRYAEEQERKRAEERQAVNKP